MFEVLDDLLRTGLNVTPTELAMLVLRDLSRTKNHAVCLDCRTVHPCTFPPISKPPSKVTGWGRDDGTYLLEEDIRRNK